MHTKAVTHFQSQRLLPATRRSEFPGIVAGDHRAGGRTTGHVDVHGGHGDDDILGDIATGNWNRTPAPAHRDTHHGLCMLVHAHDV